MSQSATRRMTVQAFSAWEITQPDRYELVDGRPVAMTGATIGHDRVLVNIVLSLGNQLRAAGNPCDAFTSHYRHHDHAPWQAPARRCHSCTPFDEHASTTDRPKLIGEALSRSTQTVDQYVKLFEYQQLASLDSILLVNPDPVEVGLWSRAADLAWAFTAFRDIGDAIGIPGRDLTLPLTAITFRVTLAPPPPRLVWPAPPTGPQVA